jgi:hypothetical protein
LANIDAKRLRVLTAVKEFVVLDSRGNVRWGQPKGGPAPWVGEPAERLHGAGYSIQYDRDSYGMLAPDSLATVVILADTATPAWITLLDGIQAYNYTPVALAAGAANLAVPYEFGGEPWREWDLHADLTVRADRLELGDQEPHTVLLQFTDTTTTGELLTALTRIAETGAERVRLHRMMGWGEIGPSDIVWVQGPESNDDEIIVGPPAKVTVERVRVADSLAEHRVETVLHSITPRFRYCYEKSSVVRPGSLELSLEVAADGTIAKTTATGFDRAVDSCVAGAMFDRRMPSGVKDVTAVLAFARGGDEPTPKDSKPISGFWCWVHQKDRRGMCARDKEECEALISSFNQMAPASGESKITNGCKAQKSAWQAGGLNTMTYPTKALCLLLEMTESCRQIR